MKFGCLRRWINPKAHFHRTRARLQRSLWKSSRRQRMHIRCVGGQMWCFCRTYTSLHLCKAFYKIYLLFKQSIRRVEAINGVRGARRAEGCSSPYCEQLPYVPTARRVLLFFRWPSVRIIRPCPTRHSRPYADSSRSPAPRSTGARSSATRSARKCRMLRGQNMLRLGWGEKLMFGPRFMWRKNQWATCSEANRFRHFSWKCPLPLSYKLFICWIMLSGVSVTHLQSFLLIGLSEDHCLLTLISMYCSN